MGHACPSLPRIGGTPIFSSVNEHALKDQTSRAPVGLRAGTYASQKRGGNCPIYLSQTACDKAVQSWDRRRLCVVSLCLVLRATDSYSHAIRTGTPAGSGSGSRAARLVLDVAPPLALRSCVSDTLAVANP